TARKHIPRTDNFIILNMETKGAKPFPKSPIYCFLNHSAERIHQFEKVSGPSSQATWMTRGNARSLLLIKA
ncbi:MAG: hypothetical protein ACR5K5_05100, partial [Wolbachia sp.]